PLARRIADLAAALRWQLADEPEAAIEGDALVSSGIAGPSRVCFRRSDRASVRTQDGPIEGDGAHRVLEAVRRKESKLSAYVREARISQLWLLLVTGDGIGQSPPIEDLRIESRFDRVYVLDARDRRLFSLKE